MAGSGPRVGVLALQGGVREHIRLLDELGARTSAVRRPEDLEEIDGIVLPGGESGAISRLLDVVGLREPLLTRLREGLPAYGTCAGLILLADRVEGAAPGQRPLGGIDATVRRNAFGRQNESFEADLASPDLGDPPVRAAFIRAPVVVQVGASARVLAALPDGRPVAVEDGVRIGTSFHPEVTGETRFHRRLLDRLG